jgi:hypothetical protein
MTYVIGTTQHTVRWYRFVPPSDQSLQAAHELLDVLDLSKVTQFETRAEARECFNLSGLRTCRYFKF